MPGDIRKKLAGALSMLLIAAIMMVSSTYAWFTLSTAPEVKGITTSIGANGNLEIALLTSSSYASTAADLGIVSAVNDSIVTTSDWTVTNVKWGNLVDLSHESYGLANIALLPSALNIDTENPDSITSPILYTPSYGSDGRVAAVDQETATGKALGNGLSFVRDDSFAGVRAIGVASEMTVRTSAYRDAVAAVSSNMSLARTAASQSLVANGSALGTLLVKLANDSNASGSYTRAEFETFGAILTALTNANNSTLESVKNAALAQVLSSDNTAELTEEQIATYQTAAAAITPENVTATSYSDFLPAEMTASDAIQAALEGYLATKTKIADVQNEYNALTMDENSDKQTYTYTEVRSVMDDILNKRYTTVAGVTDPGRDDANAIADASMTGAPMSIVMGNNSGLYDDIAKIAGNYSAGPIEMNVEVSGLQRSVNVIMSTSAATPTLLDNALSAVQGKAASGGDSSGSSSISPYAYMLDFGVRTNAESGTKLQLTEASQRVYSDSTNTETAGGGTYFQFAPAEGNTGFTLEKVKALMSAVRVAFVTPNENGFTVLAMAAPNVEAGAGVDGVDNSWKAPLALYEYTAEKIDGDVAPKVTLGAAKTGDDALTLTTLDQNVAKKISAVVYLDGDTVENDMVANGTESMTGTLNLQFKTNANLVPMEDAELRGTAQVQRITRDQLSQAVTAIKESEVYQTAVDEIADAAAQGVAPDTKYTSLVANVENVENLLANSETTEDQLQGPAQALAGAYLTAGGENPFA